MVTIIVNFYRKCTAITFFFQNCIPRVLNYVQIMDIKIYERKTLFFRNELRFLHAPFNQFFVMTYVFLPENKIIDFFIAVEMLGRRHFCRAHSME